MIPKAPAKELTISKPEMGKKVIVASDQAVKWALLKKAADNKNYYALQAQKHLEDLTNGLGGRRNVFIPNVNDYKSKTLQKFVVAVPGMVAVVETRNNGSVYKIMSLELDEQKLYELSSDSETKPGVYAVAINGPNIAIKRKGNGWITPEDGRCVVIAGAEYSSPRKAVDNISKNLDKIANEQISLTGEFDLFFSPAGKKLGGMFNYNPNIIQEAFGFAGLLADAMQRAKETKKERVFWTSENSGSVVLTQSLKALYANNVSFDGLKHMVKMHHPTTDPNETLMAGKRIGILVDKNITKGGNARASVSSLLTNGKRAMDPKDPYGKSDYGLDLANGGMGALGAVGALSLAATAATGSPVFASISALSGTAGALAWGVNTAYKRLKRGF